MSTKIEWADDTINPLGWGCYGPAGTREHPQPCSYCYAARMAKRNLRECDLCRQFVPHWHEEELKKPAHWTRPRRVFVQSMGDLFHPAIPVAQIRRVLLTAEENERHTFCFLTKHPKMLARWNPWPRNCWVGATATDDHTLITAERALEQVQATVRYISVEPMLGPVYWWPMKNSIEWLIIGGQTKPNRPPNPIWVENLARYARQDGIPLFIKPNAHYANIIQEFPEAAR